MQEKNDDPSEQAKALYRDVRTSIGEPHLVGRETLTPTEALRVLGKLDVSIAESPRAFTLNYSLRDIANLDELDSGEWVSIRSRWRSFHREQVGFSAGGLCAWCLSVLVAWTLLVHTDAVLAWASSTEFARVPPMLLQGAGATLGLGALMFVPRVLGTLTPARHWETFAEGFREGMRKGINQALRISPEQEREMREDLSRANVAKFQGEITSPQSVKDNV